MSEQENPFDEETEQFCWMDAGRPCDTKCVAYDDGMNESRGPCLMVNAMKIMANATNRVAKFASATQLSQNLPNPPKIGGGQIGQ